MGIYTIYNLYTYKKLKNTEIFIREFVKKHQMKFVSIFDNPILLIRWGVAAILNPH